MEATDERRLNMERKPLTCFFHWSKWDSAVWTQHVNSGRRDVGKGQLYRDVRCLVKRPAVMHFWHMPPLEPLPGIHEETFKWLLFGCDSGKFFASEGRWIVWNLNHFSLLLFPSALLHSPPAVRALAPCSASVLCIRPPCQASFLLCFNTSINIWMLSVCKTSSAKCCRNRLSTQEEETPGVDLCRLRDELFQLVKQQRRCSRRPLRWPVTTRAGCRLRATSTRGMTTLSGHKLSFFLLPATNRLLIDCGKTNREATATNCSRRRC